MFSAITIISHAIKIVIYGCVVYACMYVPRERVIFILLLFDLRYTQDGLEGTTDTDDGHALDQRLTQTTD